MRIIIISRRWSLPTVTVAAMAVAAAAAPSLNGKAREIGGLFMGLLHVPPCYPPRWVWCSREMGRTNWVRRVGSIYLLLLMMLLSFR